MADPIIDPTDRICNGDWSFGGNVTLPGSTITDDTIELAANIDADKLQHRHVVKYYQVAGTDVASQTAPIHIALADGLVRYVKIMPITVPSGGGVDKVYTVDIQKSTGAGAFATILSSAYTINSSKVARTVYTATLDSAQDDYSAGDSFQVVIAASGSTGSQGQGVIVAVYFDEDCA